MRKEITMSGHADGIGNVYSTKSSRIGSSMNLNPEPHQKKKMADLLPVFLSSGTTVIPHANSAVRS